MVRLFDRTVHKSDLVDLITAISILKARVEELESKIDRVEPFRAPRRITRDDLLRMKEERYGGRT